MADPGGLATRLLEHEARGLLTRLDAGAALRSARDDGARCGPRRTDAQLMRSSASCTRAAAALREKVHGYLDWLHGPGRQAGAAEAAAAVRADPAGVQRRTVPVRSVHRGHHPAQRTRDGRLAVRPRRTGAATRSGSDLDGYEQVPAVCYLARGPGAAIRRARTRLPGGESNPVAIIRVPQGTHGGQRHRKLAGARSGASGSCATGAGGVVARRPRPGGGQGPAGLLADVGQVDQRDRRRLLVGREARDHVHHRSARRRQPAGVLRLPAVR